MIFVFCSVTFAALFSPSALTIGIEDDTLPENDESVIVELSGPTGGAIIGINNSVSVIILASDHVAGVLGFEKTSYLAEEGK